MPRSLFAVPLTQDNFTPFGQVLSTQIGTGRSANQGSATRIDHAAHLHNLRPHAQPNVAIFQSMPRALPFSIRLLERHPYSTQLFSPIFVSRYVVVTAPANEQNKPDPSQLHAFLASPHQAMNFNVGVWHHPLIVLDNPADFLMLAWEDGTSDDCEEFLFPEEVLLQIKN